MVNLNCFRFHDKVVVHSLSIEVAQAQDVWQRC